MSGVKQDGERDCIEKMKDYTLNNSLILNVIRKLVCGLVCWSINENAKCPEDNITFQTMPFYTKQNFAFPFPRLFCFTIYSIIVCIVYVRRTVFLFIIY